MHIGGANYSPLCLHWWPQAVEKVKDAPRGPKFTFMHELGLKHDFFQIRETRHVLHTWGTVVMHTVLKIGENPKKNAPGILKSSTERSRNFVHIFQIFQKLNDVLPSN